MRATCLTVAALSATALLLTGCSDSGGGEKKNSADKDGTACAIGRVAVQVGPAGAAPAAGDTGDVPVSLTNHGAACTLEGFPGVDLYAADMSTNLQPAKGAKSQKLTLAKNASATFTITYERGKAGAKDVLDATTLKISLPGNSAQQSYKWSYGPVQGEGGNPGVLKASVSAFQQGGD